jgi:hypothetical protein
LEIVHSLSKINNERMLMQRMQKKEERCKRIERERER